MLPLDSHKDIEEKVGTVFTPKKKKKSWYGNNIRLVFTFSFPRD